MITKQQLGNTLWGMAEILYDKVEDYKTYILSLLFFKRLSDNWAWEIDNKVRQFVADHGKQPNAKQLARIAAEAHDFAIPEGCFWADVKNASPNEKNEKLDKAVKAIGENNPPLRGIIDAVQWNAPAPDGSGGKRLHPEVLTNLINYLDVVTLDNGNASVDILGDAYEYLIKKFADENKGGKVAGQFYTPGEVVGLMVRTIKPKAGEEVYDPTCGSGGFLIRSAKYVKESTGDAKNIRLYGQESVWTTWAIASINMIFHGLDAKIAQGDTIRAPKFTVDGELQRFDVVLANFPFSMENWWGNGQPKKDSKGKPVYKKDGSPQLEYPDKSTCVDSYGRFVYGIPPFSNGDFTFIQHIVASLNDQGRGGVVCPQGVLFRGQPEKTEEEDGMNRKADDEYLIRKGLLDGTFLDAEGRKHEHVNMIEAIVVLPANVFYGTTIPASILFFNKAKPAARRDKVLMVYAAREGWYKETANFNVLLPHDVLRILVQLEAWGDIKIAKKVLPGHVARLKADIDDTLSFKLEEIRENWLYLDRAIADLKAQFKQADAGEIKLSAVQRAVLEKRRETYEKGIAKRDAELAAAEAVAEKERQAVDAVADEVVAMLADPEQRRRYFAIVEREELEENEFNLNIPRYVDTFEPEGEIDLVEAIKGFVRNIEDERHFVEELVSTLTKIPISTATPNLPNNLPLGWGLHPLADVTTLLRRGKSPIYSEVETPYPIINQKCIEWGGINEEHLKYLSPQALPPDEFFLQDQDVLLNSTGAGTIGRVTQFGKVNATKFLADSHVTIVRIDPDKAVPKLVAELLSSEQGQRYLEAYCFTGSTNQLELSRRYLAQLKLPLSNDIEEQERIAALLGEVDQAIAATQARLVAGQKLKQALMHYLLTGKIRIPAE